MCFPDRSLAVVTTTFIAELGTIWNYGPAFQAYHRNLPCIMDLQKIHFTNKSFRIQTARYCDPCDRIPPRSEISHWHRPDIFHDNPLP